jgi:hypothetical protein
VSSPSQACEDIRSWCSAEQVRSSPPLVVDPEGPVVRCLDPPWDEAPLPLDHSKFIFGSWEEVDVLLYGLVQLQLLRDAQLADQLWNGGQEDLQPDDLDALLHATEEAIDSTLGMVLALECDGNIDMVSLCDLCRERAHEVVSPEVGPHIRVEHDLAHGCEVQAIEDIVQDCQSIGRTFLQHARVVAEESSMPLACTPALNSSDTVRQSRLGEEHGAHLVRPSR